MPFTRRDNIFRAGVNFIDKRGIFVRFTGSYVHQRFSDTPVTDLPRSNFFVGDFSIAYEFAGKRGRLGLVVGNAFDQSFGMVLEELTVEPILPRRTALTTLQWRLF
jgi:hypothetical protein